MREGRRRTATLGLTLIALAALFLSYRWWMRVEPLNSDDIILFQHGVAAAEGRHWLSAAEPLQSLSHSALRVGILPLIVPAIALFGPNYGAYVAVSLATALFAFALVWWIVNREVGYLPAALVALIHLALPFELKDGGVLLVDLPSAFFSILALLIIECAAGDRRRGIALLGGAVAGLAAVEAYLLRTNSALLLLLAIAVLAVHRHRRLPAASATAVLGLGFLAEQFLLMSRGLEFGYRWQAVHQALEAFGPFLPKYTIGEFVGREFTALWTDFEGGFAGVFAIVCYLVFLAALLAMLMLARSPLLRSLAVFGLATFGVFSYGFSSWSDGLIHALAPPIYRYFQGFYFTGLIAIGWAFGALQGQLSSGSRDYRWLAFALHGLGLAMATSAVAVSSHWVQNRLADPCGELHQIVCALDRAADASESPVILTTPRSARLVKLFRGSSTGFSGHWISVPIADFGDNLDRAQWVFLDRRRLRKDRLYLSEDAKQAYDRTLDALDQQLQTRFVVRQETQKYLLFHHPGGQAIRFRPLPFGRFENVDGHAETIAGWQTTPRLDVDEASGELGVRLKLPPKLQRAYVFSGGSRGMNHPPYEGDQYRLPSGSGWRLAVKVRLTVPPEASASLFTLQYRNSERVATDRAPLQSGTNFVRFIPTEGASTYRVAVRLAARSATSPIDVVLQEVAIRREPNAELCPCTE